MDPRSPVVINPSANIPASPYFDRSSMLGTAFAGPRPCPWEETYSRSGFGAQLRATSPSKSMNPVAAVESAFREKWRDDGSQ